MSKEKKQFKELSEEELKQVTGGTEAVKRKDVSGKIAVVAECHEEDHRICKKSPF